MENEKELQEEIVVEIDEKNENNIIEEVDTYEEHLSDNTKESVKNTPKSRKGLLAMCLVLGLSSGFASSGITLATIKKYNTNSDIVYQTVVQTDENGNEITSLSVEDIVENTKDTVVEISTSTTQMHPFIGQYVVEGAGSGVVFSKDGLIVTNHHVIADATEVKVTLANGKIYEAKIIASDIQSDLAVLRINEKNLKSAILGNSENMRVGESIYAIGNPLGNLGGTVTEGILSAKDREISIDGQPMTLLQISAAINPGNSGGGLFNSKGELVGIVNAKSSGSDIEGLGFAIPIDVTKEIVEDLVENGEVTGRLILGIKYYEINTFDLAMQSGTNALGLLIDEVTEGSNADKAGLQRGDLIVEVDDKQVLTGADLVSALRKHKAGDKMTFMVIRNNQYIDLECTLMADE